MKVHLIGVCGTGMGSLALLYRSQGHRVRGSDTASYAPMGPALRAAGIEIALGFRAENLQWGPERIVIGNVCRPDNPEARAAIHSGIPYGSFPEAIADDLIADRHSVVAAGTHGKTTTTAMLARILDDAGTDPGFLIGGVVADFPQSCRRGSGPVVVVEGDEYDSAFFDKRPKFVHYKPRTLILTSVEFDHADIYADLDAVVAAFEGLCASVHPRGRILAARGTAGDANLARALASARVPVERYGVGNTPSKWTARWVDAATGRFSFHRDGELLSAALQTPLAGDHNLQNACAALATALHLDVPLDTAAAALAGFGGVKRRQEELGEPGGVLIIDDFAHHPTAVRETLHALRQRYDGRRLWAILEPRTQTSRRRVFQAAYVEALKTADRVVIAHPYGVEALPADERLRPAEMVAKLAAAGTWARAAPRADAIVALLSTEAVSGDVVTILSNGGFDGLHDKLLDALKRKGAAT